MGAFVADTSLALKWFLDDEGMGAYQLSDIVNPPKQEKLPGIGDDEAEPNETEGKEAGKI